VTPLNPQTVAQQNQRSILAAVASEWRGLTDATRAGWKALAAQLPGNPSGFNTYVKVNATLVMLGMAKLETAPLIPSFGIMSFNGGFRAEHDQAAPHALKLTLTITNTEAPDAYLFEASAPSGQGIEFVGSAFRVISKQVGAQAITPTALAAGYIAVFGDPLDGQVVNLRVTQITKGFRGVPFMFRTIVKQTGA
jgi:hypothetical protein